MTAGNLLRPDSHCDAVRQRREIDITSRCAHQDAEHRWNIAYTRARTWNNASRPLDALMRTGPQSETRDALKRLA